jgi:hypothetical protein
MLAKVVMKLTLDDGTEIDLSNIYEVTQIKDYGFDTHTIDQSTISFIIRYKSGKSKKVSKNYHFTDWFNVYKELKALRNDIVESWQKSKRSQ